MQNMKYCWKETNRKKTVNICIPFNLINLKFKNTFLGLYFWWACGVKPAAGGLCLAAHAQQHCVFLLGVTVGQAVCTQARHCIRRIVSRLRLLPHEKQNQTESPSFASASVPWEAAHNLHLLLSSILRTYKHPFIGLLSDTVAFHARLRLLRDNIGHKSADSFGKGKIFCRRFSNSFSCQIFHNFCLCYCRHNLSRQIIAMLIPSSSVAPKAIRCLPSYIAGSCGRFCTMLTPGASTLNASRCKPKYCDIASDR